MMRSPVDENIPTLSLRRVCKAKTEGEMMTKMNRDLRDKLTLLRRTFSRIAWDRVWGNYLYSGAG
jgi:hypothetical protein